MSTGSVVAIVLGSIASYIVLGGVTWQLMLVCEFEDEDEVLRAFLSVLWPVALAAATIMALARVGVRTAVICTPKATVPKATARETGDTK